MFVRANTSVIAAICLALILMMATFSLGHAAPTPQPARPNAMTFPSEAWPPLYPSPTDRLGYGVAWGIERIPLHVLERLQAGWYVNWSTSPHAVHPANLRYVQIVHLRRNGYKPEGSQLVDIIQRNPGSLWLIGNEPDSPYQDNQTPEQYVEKYHELYYLIKSVDPTALIAIGGVIQATPLRLQYLDMIWDLYRERYGEEMPVDVWNVHNFILREASKDCPAGGAWGAFIPPGISEPCGKLYSLNDHDNMAIFQQQIRTFRAWMKAKGQQNKPLIVSEYGILFPEELGFTTERVRTFMLATFDFFLNARDPDLGYPADDYRLVQQWAWFSLDYTSFEWGTTRSALYDPEQGTLTPLGEAFAEYAASHQVMYHDLRPTGLNLSTSEPVPFGGSGTVDVAVRVVNEGIVPASGKVNVDRRVEDGWHSVGSARVSDVPRRFEGEQVVHFSDQITMRAPLRYRIWVTSPGDARRSNNIHKVSVKWDVAVASVLASAGYAEGDGMGHVRVRVVITNPLSLPLANVPVRVSNLSSPSQPSITNAIPQIDPHSTASTTFDLYLPQGQHRLRAEVDPDNIVQEVDEANNSVTFQVWVFPHRHLLPLISHNR